MPVPRPGPLVGAALLALTLTACSDSTADDDSAARTTAAAADTSTARPTSVPGTEVDVSATEFAFGLSQQDFTAGEYTFVLTDDGSAPHALTITGPGVDASSDRVGPGATAELTVTLQAGEYELLCPVGNHADQGMRTTITVA